MTTLAFSQHQRLLTMTTPLDKGELIATEIEGTDAISIPFQYTIKLVSQNRKLDIESLLGKTVGIELEQEQKTVLCHGHILSIEGGKVHPRSAEYFATIVPWFDLLKLKQDSRVYQHQSVVDIFSSVCKELGYHDFDTSKLTKSYPKIDYCIQYQESFFNFLSRQLEQAGIFYLFTYEKNKHTLHLCDDQNQCPHFSHDIPLSKQNIHQQHFSQWQQTSEVFSNHVALKDYNYQEASNNLEAQSQTQQNLSFKLNEHYRFPGNYQSLQQGTTVAQHALNVNKWQASTIAVTGNQVSLQPGQFFTVQSSNNHNVQGKFFITAIKHHVQDATHHNDEQKESIVSYHQELICIHENLTYTPPLTTPTPEMAGIHTATVVGPSNQEMYTNESGCIKIQFPWDKQGEHNENASCWIRPSQSLAGKNMGMQMIPRIGDQVAVQFLYGDPNRPVVIGSMPTQKNKPPFDNKHSGIKTHSFNNKDPKAGNRLSFGDEAGKEKITLHAQKDFKIDVLDSFTQTTKGSENITVDGKLIQKIIKGSAKAQAKTITLKVGNNQINLSDSGITIQANNVNFLTKGAGSTKPLARVGDKHICPRLTPAITPHKGGPILTGSTNVMINGMPAARAGDKAHCHGATDGIKQGVSSLLINGKPAARLNDAMNHGGVINTGSPTVSSGEATGQSIQLSANTNPQNGQQTYHWIRASYQDHQGKPMSGLPYCIDCDDGTVARGKLDASGKTHKVTNLQAASAHITLGDKQKLEQELEQQRQTLKKHLDMILAKVKQEAKKQTDEYNKEGWFIKTVDMSGSLIKSLAEGAWDSLKAGAVGVVHLFGDMARSQADADMARYGDAQAQAYAQQDMIKLGHKMYDPIFKAVRTMHLLFRDPGTRQILMKFAEDYYHSETKLMISKQIAHITGGLVPAIIVAVITKNPESFAAGVTETGEVAAASDELTKINKTLDELEKCQELKAADMDKEHQLTLAKAPNIPYEYFELYKEGGSVIMTKQNYLRFVEPYGILGRKEGQFITSKIEMDKLLANVKNNRDIEKALGVTDLQGKKLYRIDIDTPLSLNPRLPDGSLSGANEHFIPGGKTSGGLTELVIDQIPKGKFHPHYIGIVNNE